MSGRDRSLYHSPAHSFLGLLFLIQLTVGSSNKMYGRQGQHFNLDLWGQALLAPVPCCPLKRRVFFFILFKRWLVHVILFTVMSHSYINCPFKEMAPWEGQILPVYTNFTAASRTPKIYIQCDTEIERKSSKIVIFSAKIPRVWTCLVKGYVQAIWVVRKQFNYGRLLIQNIMNA